MHKFSRREVKKNREEINERSNDQSTKETGSRLNEEFNVSARTDKKKIRQKKESQCLLKDRFDGDVIQCRQVTFIDLDLGEVENVYEIDD